MGSRTWSLACEVQGLAWGFGVLGFRVKGLGECKEEESAGVPIRTGLIPHGGLCKGHTTSKRLILPHRFADPKP